MSEPLLSVRDLRKEFTQSKGMFGREKSVVKAVDGVSFDIQPGETMGLVGESGCGKTTTGRCLMRVIEPTGGEILYRDRQGKVTDLAQLDEPQMLPFWRDIRMVFQDPQSSLNPRLPVIEIVGQGLRVQGIARGRELEDRVAELLRRVGLRPEYLHRYPNSFSGGQRQRIGIARALALNPRLIVADEAVSALDVSIQAQTLNLMQDLQDDLGLTYLFIAHDLAVVEHICDRVAVMYNGRIVEMGPTAEIFSNPAHEYTRTLLDAAPVPDPSKRRRRRAAAPA